MEAVIAKHQPDFIGIQETKVSDPDFPVEAIQAMGYHVEFHGQKTHYGVALMSKHPFNKVQKGYVTDTEESQKRFILGEFTLPSGKQITVINGYFPQGENRDHPIKFPNKLKYYADLQAHIEASYKPSDLLVVMGDMNISHTDLDIDRKSVV